MKQWLYIAVMSVWPQVLSVDWLSNKQNKEAAGLQVQHVIYLKRSLLFKCHKKRNISANIILIRKQCGILSKLLVLWEILNKVYGYWQNFIHHWIMITPYSGC
jgi:hypothetical protein